MAPSKKKGGGGGGGGGGKDVEVKGPCIGIDLGTHSSAVAVIRADAPTVVANAQGNHTTPSIVSFSDAEMLVGEVAAAQAVKNQANTVVEGKRLLGKKHDDADLAKDKKRWRFGLAAKDGKAGVSVLYKGATESFSAEAICGFVLASLKATAEAFVHSPVKHCVLAAPIHFSDEQREALSAAAATCGLTCLRVISEPVAAALAYDLDKPGGEAATVAVFNMGSVSSDVTLLRVSGGFVQQLGYAVDHELGGSEVDDNLVAFCCKEFQRKNKMDPSENARALAKIKAACEQAKIQLSQSPNAKVFVESAHEGIDLNVAASSARFEQMNSALFNRIPELARRALAEAGLAVEGVDKVVLVGGPTRIPKVQALVQAAFDGKEVCSSVPPEAAVAMGCAVQAEALVGVSVDTGESLNRQCEVPSTPRDIFIGAEGGGRALVVPKGTPLPCERVLKFDVAEGATSAHIEVLEGDQSGGGAAEAVASLVLEEIEQGPVTVSVHVTPMGEIDIHAKDASGTARHNVSVGPADE